MQKKKLAKSKNYKKFSEIFLDKYEADGCRSPAVFEPKIMSTRTPWKANV
jgi:hypothetical protein